MIGMTVDADDFKEAMNKAEFTEQEVMDILIAGGVVMMSTQKLLVPVASGATLGSIHIEPSGNKAEILVGASTDYSPFIEYGTSNPNYPVQPFIVPSATGRSKANTIRAVSNAILAVLRDKGLI